MAYLKGVNLSASSNIDGTAANFISISGSSITGSFTGSLIGNIVGTASRATVANISNTALTASYMDGANVDGTVLSATSASFAIGGDGNFTGSFTGSFTGDGSNLTGVTAAGTLSSSAQIASDISGAFGAPSSSFSTRITAQETFSSSLDATFATEAELNTATASLSSSLATDIASLVIDSASFSTKITANENFSSSLSSTIISYTGSFSGDGSNLTGVVAAGTISSSAQIASDISGAFTDASASLAQSITDNASDISNNASDITANSSSLAASITTVQTNLDNASGSLAQSITDNASDITANSASIAVLDNTTVKLTGDQSIAGTKTFTEDILVQGTASINYLKTIYETSSVIYSSGSTKFGDTLDDTHIRTGSLLITGSSYTINGEDIIITSALNAATSSLSSSLATGIASDSASLAASITTNSASAASDIAALVTDSGSFSTRVTDLETFSSSLDDTFATEAELNSATASLSASLATDIATNSASIAAVESFPYTGSAFITGSLTVTGSVDVSGSVTAHSFNIDPTATGTPTLASPTILNLSASDAVVITSSPLRVASLTTTERGTFTAQNGDIIFNTTLGKYQVYSGSAWTNVLQTEDKYDEIAVTVVNDGGNKYAFDGVTAPKLSLNKGTTYRFDLSDSSNSNHPLAFRLPNDTSYTTGITTVGTAGNTGAYVEFDVDFATSSSLKYYCTVHGNGMGNVIQLIDLYNLVATGSLQGTSTTASYVEASNIDGTVTSASYALTASYAENVPLGTGFPYTGSAIVSGSLIVTGSIYSDSQIYATASHAISASLAQTASYVTTAQTASYVAGANVDGTITSASYAITSSYPLEGFIDVSASGLNFIFTRGNQTTETVQATLTGSVENAVSSSYALTASYAENAGGGGVTSIIAGSGISIDQSTGNVTISSHSSIPASVVSSSFTNTTSTTLTHNFDSTNVLVAVYDGSGNEIIPSSITLDSNNEVTATFASAQSGDIVAIEPQTGEYSESSFTSTGSVTLNHSLGTQNLNVVAYNTSNVQFIPDIQVIDGNNVKATFSGLESGNLLAVAKDGSVSASFSNTVDETITHNLNGQSLYVTVYDSSYNEIIPDSLSIIDDNNINITFAATSSGNVVITGGEIVEASGGSAYKATISGSSSYTITHNLNEEWPLVQVYESSSRAQYIPQSIVSVNANSVQLTFSTTFDGVVSINS